MGITLADVDLGAIDAEADTKLASDFITTDYVESALSAERTLFLGRKGSGKSAVFRQLPRLVAEAHRQVHVDQLTPDEYSWAALKRYREDGITAEQAHTNAWRLTLGIRAATALAALDYDWPYGARHRVERLQKFIQANFGDIDPSMQVTATAVLSNLESFDLGAFGFKAGATFRRGSQAMPVAPGITKAILAEVKEVVAEHGLILELDRLDDSWDGSEDSKSLLIGLLKAQKQINDDFGNLVKDRGLRVLVFLRSDIYDVLKFDDKDKHRSTEEHLLWNEENLREMLQKRLPHGLTVEDLFEEGTMRGSPPLNHILNRTFLRPRELLQFVDLAKQRSGSDAVEIGKDDIRAAEEQYSAWKVDDLRQEYSRAEPHFEELLEALRQGLHRYESVEQLEERLEERAPRAAGELSARQMVELLFNTSVIGIRLGGAGKTRFKSSEANLLLPSAGTVYVHQSLQKGLNIMEARKRR